MKSPAIESLRARCYRVPTDTPEADGTFQWTATEMLVVEVHAGGRAGLGYSYTAAHAAASLVRDKLAPVLEGLDALDVPAAWRAMNHRLRNVGRPGTGLMAIAAVDHALWDLKARLLDVPLVRLWGRVRPGVPIYGSGGFTNYDDAQLARQLEGWVEQGIPRVKMKIGRDAARDAERLRVAREAIGPHVELMVDANGAFHPRGALAIADALDDADVRWFEEPVSSDDLDGLAWLRDRLPPRIAVAAGEYGWDAIYFRRMLQAHAVDVLQADATRCGCSGLLETSALCTAFEVPLSAHCAPALHASLCAAVPGLAHVEYFFDHARLEGKLFDGLSRLQDGHLWPQDDRPGHGLELREADAARYLI